MKNNAKNNCASSKAFLRLIAVFAALTFLVLFSSGCKKTETAISDTAGTGQQADTGLPLPAETSPLYPYQSATSKTASANTEENTQAASENAQAASTGKITVSYSLDEIAKHSTKEDCWMAINGKVYDVSPFIALGKHPPAIVQGCGIDATVLFETRPSGSGTPHSQNARNLLAKYYIGELAS